MSDPNCPEFNGYNTKVIRESNAQLKPATTAVFRPLIDMTPGHPDTIMTHYHQQIQRLKRTLSELTYKHAFGNIQWILTHQI